MTRVPNRPRLTTRDLAPLVGEASTRGARRWIVLHGKRRLGARRNRRGYWTVSRVAFMAWRRQCRATMRQLRKLTHDIFVKSVLPNIREESPLAALFRDSNDRGDYRIEGQAMVFPADFRFRKAS